VCGSSLFICGSLNPRTLEQVERLGCPTIPGGAPEAVTRTLAALAQGDIAVISSAGWPGSPTTEEVAASLGQTVAAVAEQTRPDALLLTGGDTARAVLGALEGHGIELDEEILPGMPAGRIAGGQLGGVRVITKAGGFGPPNALVRARDYLRGGAAPNEETTP
jgi:uncharacterized protein YgbK (DUF1537 family)